MLEVVAEAQDIVDQSILRWTTKAQMNLQVTRNRRITAVGCATTCRRSETSAPLREKNMFLYSRRDTVAGRDRVRDEDPKESRATFSSSSSIDRAEAVVSLTCGCPRWIRSMRPTLTDSHARSTGLTETFFTMRAPACTARALKSLRDSRNEKLPKNPAQFPAGRRARPSPLGLKTRPWTAIHSSSHHRSWHTLPQM